MVKEQLDLVMKDCRDLPGLEDVVRRLMISDGILPKACNGGTARANPFTNDFKEILLIGPLGLPSRENRFSGKRGL